MKTIRLFLKKGLVILFLLSWVSLVFADIEAITYYSGNPQEKEKIDIATNNFIVYRIFDHKIAYRNDMKPFITFKLPKSDKITSARAEITAHNDDAMHLRAVWFEIDGIGGYIGTYKLDIEDAKEEWAIKGRDVESKEFRTWAADQVRGEGVIREKETDFMIVIDKAFRDLVDVHTCTPSEGEIVYKIYNRYP